MTPTPSSPVALLDQLDELRAAGTADGPWRLVDHEDRHGPENRYEILDDEGSVAVCSDDNDSTETTGAQRAALLVGAVNALGPLAEIVREMWDEHDGRTCCDRTFESFTGTGLCDTRLMIESALTALSVTP